MMGEWSSAGNMLKLHCGAPWFAAMPQEAWPNIDVSTMQLWPVSLVAGLICNTEEQKGRGE